MTRQLRKRHLVLLMAFALAVPLFFIAAIAARRHIPLSPQVTIASDANLRLAPR